MSRTRNRRCFQRNLRTALGDEKKEGELAPRGAMNVPSFPRHQHPHYELGGLTRSNYFLVSPYHEESAPSPSATP
jgi:hypothetical protein